MEPTQSTRGQRRRTKAKRERALAPARYNVGTFLYREVIADKDTVIKGGQIVKKGKKYLQSVAEVKRV